MSSNRVSKIEARLKQIGSNKTTYVAVNEVSDKERSQLVYEQVDLFHLGCSWHL